MNTYTLSFYNISVLLEFTPRDTYVLPNRGLEDQIVDSYSSLIEKDGRKKSLNNYKIIFKQSNNIRQIALRNRNFYAEFYYKVSKNTFVTYYHISLLQFQLLLHIILHSAISKGAGWLLHSSANSIGNKAILFIGKSGSGKSTITKLLNPRYITLADDSIILDNDKTGYVAYQTPFLEKSINIVKTKKKFSLGVICFLKKSKEYRLHKLKDKPYIYKKLLQSCVVEDKTAIQKNMGKIYTLIGNFHQFYLLEFGLNEERVKKLFTNESIF